MLRGIPEDARLREQWNALAASVPNPQVFYTYEWALAVQRSYSATLHPLLLLAYDERNSLTGLGALAVDPANRVSFLCATTGDYCDFLSSPEDRPALVASILGELRKLGCGEITLTNLPADSETATALQQACAQRSYRIFARTAYNCAQVVLSRLERRTGKTKPYLPRRKMVRHSLNVMARDGEIRLDHAASWDAVQPILPQFARTHVGRFLYTERISNLARPERRRFLDELARLMSEAGWLAVSRLMAGDHTCAWNYGFRYQGAWFWYQPTFDSDLEKHSPGFCLITKIVEEAADLDEFKVVDMGLGAEEYKDRLANQSRRTLYVTLRSSLAQHCREKIRYYASAALRIHPRIEQAARSVLQRLSRSRSHISTAGAKTWVLRRIRETFWLQTEVYFYEFAGARVPGAGPWQLRLLDLDALADATCQYVDDQPTLDYLLRSASRLRSGKAGGYALVDAAGNFLHFAWTTEFEGFFLSELNAMVSAPSPDCVMLFDCWTPVNARGDGHYGRAITLMAEAIREAGKRAWIFSAAENTSSVRGIEKAGFERRYSLTRQRLFGIQRIKGETPKMTSAELADIPVRASRCG